MSCKLSPTTCPPDWKPFPLQTILPKLTVINTFLSPGPFPNTFEEAWVTPLFKKPTFNSFLVKINRPVSTDQTFKVSWQKQFF